MKINMNFSEAYSWLNQPGIKAMMPVDPHTQVAIQKAMEALKKQIAIPFVTGKNERDNTTYLCPSCGLELAGGDWYGKPNENWLEYCEQCGQKIKWIER